MKLKRSQIPLYYQLEQILREKIASGEISHDRLFPTEVEICEQYGVSRSTVRQALLSLINEGIISRIPGKGTFLSRKDSRSKTFHYFTTIQDLVALSEKAKNRIFYRGIVSSPKKITLLLDLDPGEKTFCLRGVRILDDLPLCYFAIFVPAEFAPFFDGEKLKTGAIQSILERKSGMKTEKCRQTISAQKADERVARFLGMNEGDPVLRFERVHYVMEDRPIEVALSDFHPERYHYVMEFKHEP